MDIGKEIKGLIKEETIRFLKNIKTDDKEKINNVINFLQRGWKFEDMWEELLRDTYYFPTCMVMSNLKKKYFPPKFDKIKKEEIKWILKKQ